MPEGVLRKFAKGVNDAVNSGFLDEHHNGVKSGFRMRDEHLHNGVKTRGSDKHLHNDVNSGFHIMRRSDKHLHNDVKSGFHMRRRKC